MRAGGSQRCLRGSISKRLQSEGSEEGWTFVVFAVTK